MGLIIGIFVCLLAIPVSLITAFLTHDFNTGTATSSQWWIAFNSGITVLVGAAIIYTHYYPINW